MGSEQLTDLKRWLARRFWALLAGGLLQGASIIWWAATMSARVDAAERNVERLYDLVAARAAVHAGDEQTKVARK